MQAARRATLTEPSPPARGRAVFVTVAAVGLALDVVTKVLVVDRLDPQAPVPLLGGLLTLRLIRNSGAAFSQGEGLTWVFAVAAVLVLAFVLVRLVPRIGTRGWGLALGLLVAGVAGNLVDRLFRAPGVLRGHVVDFLQLPHWPIFNVADMCITSAAVLIILLALVRGTGVDGRRAGEAEAAAQDAARREDGSETDGTAGDDETGADAARPAGGA